MIEAKVESCLFQITYDAPEGEYALHQIDAEKLANAILGMRNLIVEAVDVVTGGHETVRLKVTAPVKEGSVVVSFMALATSPAALEAISYLGFGVSGASVVGGSLVALVKKIGGRKITNVIVEKEAEDAKITVGDEVIVANKKIVDLVISRKVREALGDVVKKPLDGIDGSVFKVLSNEDAVLLEIPASDTHGFSPLPKGSLEEERVEKFMTTVSFAQVNFSSANGWRMVMPDRSEKAVTLKDEAFIGKVYRNQAAFKKEDLFEVEVEMKSTIRPTRSKHEYSILKVTKHFVDSSRKLLV